MMKKLVRGVAMMLILAMLLGFAGCGSTAQPYNIVHTVSETSYGIAFRQGDAIAKYVTAAMKVLASNGTISRLSVQWLKEDCTCLTGKGTEINDLMEEIVPRTLIVGIDDNFGPMSGFDGVIYTGLCVDLAYAIGDLLGWEIRFQPMTATELSAQIASGNVDCALGFDTTNLSEEKYTIGDSFISSHVVVATRPDSKYHTMRSMRGERLGALTGSSVIAVAENDRNTMKYVDGITSYLTVERCLSALDSGWCSGIVLDEILLKSYFG